MRSALGASPTLLLLLLTGVRPAAAQSDRAADAGQELIVRRGPAKWMPKLSPQTRTYSLGVMLDCRLAHGGGAGVSRLAWRPSLLLERATQHKGTRLDLDLFGGHFAGQHRGVFVAPTAGFRLNLASSPRTLVPFLEWRVGPYVTRATGDRSTAWHAQFGTNATIGLRLKDRLTVRLRYDWAANAVGRDLAGVTFGVGVTPFSW